jgi:hypothetical protein
MARHSPALGCNSVRRRVSIPRWDSSLYVVCAERHHADSVGRALDVGTEQVYGPEWTVADPADLAGFDFADRLASAKCVSPSGDSRPPGTRPREGRSSRRPTMRSISSAQPAVGAAVLTRDQTSTDQPQARLPRARTHGGKSLVPFWRRWWRSL